MSKIDTDVVIVGGGMVGLAMAASFAGTSQSVVVIEKNEINKKQVKQLLSVKPIKPDSYLSRVSAISPGNQQFLQQLGCWQKIPDTRLSDYERMVVWDGEGNGKIEFRADDLGEKHLGSIVENEVLRASIYEHLSDQGFFRMIAGQTVESIRNQNSCIEIMLQDGTEISGKLLIAADGALSRIRQLVGADIEHKAYNQVAIVANVKTEKPHQSTAWQQFNSTGPVAFLPMSQPNICSVVWSFDEDKIESININDPDQFIDSLNDYFGHKLGDLTLLSEVQCFPLIKRHVHSYLADRCVLIGDAAHTIHPLAGQGVNLGFQDVKALSFLIAKLQDKGRDFGLKSNLRPFERERASENRLMQETMSGFKWLFGQEQKLVKITRNRLMSLLDNMTSVKEMLIRRAMGL